MGDLFKKIFTNETFHVYHKNLQQGTIVKTKNFRVDIQKSTNKLDNYQIQINKKSLGKKGPRTYICGILIDKPNRYEIYELESDYIKKAFTLALKNRELIRVEIGNNAD